MPRRPFPPRRCRAGRNHGFTAGGDAGLPANGNLPQHSTHPRVGCAPIRRHSNPAASRRSHLAPTASCRSRPSNGYSCQLHSNPTAYSHRHTPSCRIPHPAIPHPVVPSFIPRVGCITFVRSFMRVHLGPATPHQADHPAAFFQPPPEIHPMANILSLIGITAPPSPNSRTSSSRTSSYLVIRTDIPDRILLSGRLSLKMRLGCAQFRPVMLAPTGATCSAASFGGHGLARRLRLARQPRRAQAMDWPLSSAEVLSVLSKPPTGRSATQNALLAS